MGLSPCVEFTIAPRARALAQLGYSASHRAITGHSMGYENILTRVEGKTGVITLNRPKQLNALNDQLMTELGQALAEFNADPNIACAIITGSEKAFAAGADIGAMASYSFADVYQGDYITRNWEQIRQMRKPVIAAVSGFALGGGCELAMMCDILIAADNARFGQPEIKLGVIPGAGGTQRLPRTIGKAKAMDMILTGRMMDALEAERCGLASRVVPLDKLMQEALAVAAQIGELAPIAVMAAKESVNRAFEGSLSDGIMFERRLFHALFATTDQKEGMDAFVNKRKPQFKGQ
jgi:enoyl-CoA hydratase